MQLSSNARIPDGLLAEMTLLNEKPRLGLRTSESTPYPGFTATQSTTALGHSWSVASGTRWASLSCDFGVCGGGPGSFAGGNSIAVGGPIILTPPQWLLGFFAQFTTATGNALHAPPLKVNSGVCSIYGNQRYLRAGLQCVCQGAGDSPWSQDTRGALAADQLDGIPEFIGHATSYTGSTLRTGLPPGAVAKAYGSCFSW